MKESQKAGRYQRIYNQLEELLAEETNVQSKQVTIIAVLHHKIEYFFWTGFYFLHEGELVIGPYQGPVACIRLKKDTGVCWASINREEAIVVDNVHEFPGHIACDSRSNSEIVIPLKNENGEIIGVLDVDSKELNSFDEVDREWLTRILKLI